FNCADADADFRCDVADNCPSVANHAQRDCDADGIGDECDPDLVDQDSDGVDDACDNCVGIANPGQEDGNGDRIADACDRQGKLDTRGCYSASDTLAPPDGTEPVFEDIDIHNTGTPIFVSYYQPSQPLPIGFDFDFYGKTYTNLYASGGGYLSFLPNQSAPRFPGTIPSRASENAAIFALLHDQLSGYETVIWVQTVGEAPNRRFIMQSYNDSEYAIYPGFW